MPIDCAVLHPFRNSPAECAGTVEGIERFRTVYKLIDGELPPGLILNEDTGEISGTCTSAVSKTYAFYVRIIIVNYESSTTPIFLYKWFSLDYVAEGQTIQLLPPDGTIIRFKKELQNTFNFQVIGGIPPHVFSYVIDPESDPLPDTLTFSDQGRLSGTPKEIFNGNILVTVDDATSTQILNETRATNSYIIEISDSPSIDQKSEVCPCVAPGQSYPSYRLEAYNGILPLKWSLPDPKYLLPTGLTLNEKTGAIEGATTAPEGLYIVKFRVEDATGQVDELYSQLTVSATCEDSVYSETEINLNFNRIPSAKSTPVVVGNKFFRNNLKNYLPDIY